MKISNGSIQCKGTRFYLVIRRGRRQKWIALKTSERATALMRAHQITAATTDEVAWLRHLVQLGQTAQRSLTKQCGDGEYGWDRLLDVYLEKTCTKRGGSEESSFARWLHILKENVGGAEPTKITADEAHRAIVSIAGKYISCRRMLGFFRRCWIAVGFDASIWKMDVTTSRHVNERGKSQEFYRRFTIDEVRRIYRNMLAKSSELADMIAIGYFTGLRLSDVTELDTSEVTIDRTALRIIPNKTRQQKRTPLLIPLVHEAAEAVARRIAATETVGRADSPDFGTNPEDGGRFLFPPEHRHRPSRRLCAAFAACGIAKDGNARSSFHSLRATFVSMMDEAGIPPHITDAITGHGGGGMHARYTQPSLQALRDALLKALPPLTPHPSLSCQCD